MANTPPGGPGENPNNKNNNVNKQKFINDFCNNQINKGSNKNIFLDSIFDAKEIKGDLNNSLEKELTGGKTVTSILDDKGNKSVLDKYKGVKLEDIKLSDLKNKLFIEFNRLKSKRKFISDSILSDYDLLSNKQKLDEGISDLSEKDLENFNTIINSSDKDKLESINKRNEKVSSFLEGIFGKEILNKKRKKTDVLIGIKKELSNLDNKELEKINIENSNILGELNSLDTTKKLNSTSDLPILADVLKLQSVGYSFKKKIIINFLPTITLEQAKRIGINLGNIENDLKKDIVKDIFKNDNLTDDELSIYVGQLDFNDNEILLDTSGLLSDTENIKKLILSDSLNGDFLANFIVDYNSELDEFEGGLDKNTKQFIESLSNIDKVKGSNKFKKGAFIVIDQNIENKNSTDKNKTKSSSSKFYFKVLDDGSDNGKVKLQNKGVDSFINDNSDSKDFSYEDLLKYINNPKVINSFEVINENDLHSRFLSGEIEKSTNELDLKTENESNEIISKLEIEKNRIEDELIKKYQDEGKSHEEINKLLYEYDDKGLKTRKYKNAELKILQDKLDKAGNFNKAELIEKIKLIDTNYDSNKFDFDVGTTFTTKKADGTFYYKIESFDQLKNGGEIIVSDFLNRPVTLSFLEFLEAFKKESGTITSTSSNQMGDFSQLLDSLNSDNEKIKGSWGHYSFSNNQILKNNTNNDNQKSGINYDYLVADSKDGKGNELIQIHSFSGDKVKVSFGEYEEKFHEEDIEKKGIKKGDLKNKSFGVNSKHYEITIGELYSRIAKFKLRPRALDEEKDVVEDNVKTIDREGSFGTRFFKRMSFKDIFAGAKLGVESIESYMKESEEEQAAKFANSVFGSVLPSEISNDLLTRVEGAQKKRQDDYIQKLKDVDSGPATKMIIGWLKNSDTVEYKKEAGMIFMLEKYGVLYAKDLTEFKGSFLWYEAMGGKVGDALYLEVKKEAEEEDDMPFTEEQLLFRLIVKQCKGEAKPKRRSRLHKDYNRHRNQGKEEEVKTGQQDAGNKRNVEGRVRYVFGEMEGGTYPNGRGGYEQVIAKGGTMQQMSEVPFVMMFSGVAYGYEQDELDAWKDFPTKGMPIPITKFLGHTSSIDMFNKSVLEITKLISENDIKYKNMYKDALVVFGNQRKTEGDKEKIKRGRAFFAKQNGDYGKVLIDALSMLNISDYGDDSKYADLIVTQKDKKGNSALSTYYNAFHSGDEFNFQKDEYMTDAFHSAGTSGMKMEKMASDVLLVGAGNTLRKPESAKIVWSEITDAFHAISLKSYDSEEDREVKLQHELSGLLAGLMQNVGSQAYLTSYNSPTSTFSRLNDRGVYMQDIIDEEISPVEMREGTGKAKILLDKYIKQIIAYEKEGYSSKRSDTKLDFNPLDLIGTDIKSTTIDIMEKK